MAKIFMRALKHNVYTGNEFTVLQISAEMASMEFLPGQKIHLATATSQQQITRLLLR